MRPIGQFYVDEDSVEELTIESEWFLLQSGTLYVQISREGTDYLLRQHGAEQLALQLANLDPDPPQKVEIEREGHHRFYLKPV